MIKNSKPLHNPGTHHIMDITGNEDLSQQGPAKRPCHQRDESDGMSKIFLIWNVVVAAKCYSFVNKFDMSCLFLAIPFQHIKHYLWNRMAREGRLPPGMWHQLYLLGGFTHLTTSCSHYRHMDRNTYETFASGPCCRDFHTITNIHVKKAAFDYTSWLPRNLITLKLENIQQNEYIFLNGLPNTLKHLSITRAGIKSIDYFPEGLTHLYLYDSTVESLSLSQLPKNLTHLALDGCLRFNKMMTRWGRGKTSYALPPDLKYFYIMNGRGDPTGWLKFITSGFEDGWQWTTEPTHIYKWRHWSTSAPWQRWTNYERPKYESDLWD